MKLNGTPRHYMPLSQSQSDDEENGSKVVKVQNSCKNSEFSESFNKRLTLQKPPAPNKKGRPMSFLRMLAFISSSCICLIFIAAFLFLLPCRPETLGVGNIGDLLEKWTITLPNISFSSDVAMALTSHLSSPSLIFGYSSWINDSYATNGVIAIRKYDGAELWKKQFHFESTYMSCDAIDVNEDGFNDCLVVGKNGVLTAIDPKTGENLWYMHNHRGIKLPDSISPPTVLPDCDEDGVPDLASSGAFLGKVHLATLALISGATGEVIGSPVSFVHCTSEIFTQLAVPMKNKTAFIFYCSGGKAGQLFLSYVGDICDLALNRTERMSLTLLYRSVSSTPNFQMFGIPNGKLMALFESKAVLFRQTRKGKLKITWQKDLEDGLHWNVVAYGSFLKSGSSELVLLSHNNTVSKVVGLDVISGEEVWSGSFNNSIVTSVFSIPKFFRDVDGIVLKALKPSHEQFGIKKRDYPFLHSGQNFSSILNESDGEVTNFTKNDVKKLTEESFILVHVKDLPRAKIISIKEVMQDCKGGTCIPDVYTKKRTAVAEVLSNGEVDVCMVSASAVLEHSDMQKIETYVKLLKIEKFSKLSKCMYELKS